MLTPITKIYINRSNILNVKHIMSCHLKYPRLVWYQMIISASCTERGHFPKKFAQVMMWLLAHQSRSSTSKDLSCCNDFYSLRASKFHIHKINCEMSLQNHEAYLLFYRQNYYIITKVTERPR